ncbi:MAG: single-stranded DNA-binding protein [Clostridiales bacterium]|nr:single-stranded DNA-binding protein [Clostridiales bacterium]
MINITIVQGRLTRDPELQHTQSGKTACHITVANSKKVNDYESKLFLNCTAWGKTAEFISKYWKKGQEIIVSGELWNRDWEDREGNKRTSTECTISAVHFCGKKEDGSTSNTYRAAVSPVDISADELDIDDGDLPF